MNGYNKIARRRFLKLLVITCGLASILRIDAPMRGATSVDTNSLAIKLTSIFNDKRSASIVGHRYLEKAPHEADAQKLVDMICGSRARRQYLGGGYGESIINSLIAENKREDFVHGRTVRVAGWTLSQTEARLCALTAVMLG